MNEEPLFATTPIRAWRAWRVTELLRPVRPIYMSTADVKIETTSKSRLRSVTMNDVWEPGKMLTARCPVVEATLLLRAIELHSPPGEHARLNLDIIIVVGSVPSQFTVHLGTKPGEAYITVDPLPGDPPHLECACGIYALKTLPAGLTWFTYHTDADQVWGTVDLFGRVIEHEDGYRAQRARITGLANRRLAVVYGVPVVDPDYPNRL